MLRILLWMAAVAGLVWLSVSLLQAPEESGRSTSLYTGPLPALDQGGPRLAGWQSVPIPAPDENAGDSPTATESVAVDPLGAENSEERP